MNEHKEKLLEIYDVAEKLIGSKDEITSPLLGNERRCLETILKYSEKSKGVLTVAITSILYKMTNPKQDIRMHQHSMDGGYSGRTFDTRYITPFLKEKNFPAMAESGWLTRSLEQNYPYTLDYRGKITPTELREAFLKTLDFVEKGADCREYLTFLFQGLILARNKKQITLARPANIPISKIIEHLISHFDGKYGSSGASRLPVLAIYAVYQCMMDEVGRFQGKKLLSLESHTAADARSGTIGDIEVRDEDEKSFEAVEVKHGILITLQMVKDAYAKFSSTPAKRYYILSTVGINEDEATEIDEEIQKIKNLHGCQIIANGLVHTVKYYLRLLNEPYEFIDKYATLVETDKALKFEHKERWNQIIGGHILKR